MIARNNYYLGALSISAILLLASNSSFAKQELRIDIRRILEAEQNKPEYTFIASIYCQLGIEANENYVPIFTKTLIPAIGNSLVRVGEDRPFPTYNIVTIQDKELLKEVRIALVIRTMRKICPNVW